jgi:hypothetical protein
MGTARPSAADLATGIYPKSVTLGDVNGDGKPDLAVANFSSNTVGVLLGNGNGTFQRSRPLPRAVIRHR